MKLSDMTIQEMQASTKAEIITSIKNYLQDNFTRRDLIRMLRDRDTEWDEPIRTYRPDGQIESQIEVERDDDTQIQVSRRVTTWTYYNTGEVNVIKIEIYDENDVLKKTKRIKHYRDGRQPEATE